MFSRVEAKIIRKYFKAPFECNPWAVILNNLSASTISDDSCKDKFKGSDTTPAPGPAVSVRR